jgi:hypothetical protein
MSNIFGKDNDGFELAGGADDGPRAAAPRPAAPRPAGTPAARPVARPNTPAAQPGGARPVGQPAAPRPVQRPNAPQAPRPAANPTQPTTPVQRPTQPRVVQPPAPQQPRTTQVPQRPRPVQQPVQPAPQPVEDYTQYEQPYTEPSYEDYETVQPYTPEPDEDLLRQYEQDAAPLIDRPAPVAEPTVSFDDDEELTFAPQPRRSTPPVPVAVAEPPLPPKPEKPRKANSWGAILRGDGSKKDNGVAKTPGSSQWAGRRRGVLIGRIVTVAIVLLAFAVAINSIVNPPKGPTPSQVKAVALEAVGQTGFPLTTGESVAVAFTRAFYNSAPAGDNGAEIREERLSHYVSQDLLNTIDNTFSYQNAAGESANATQTITDGPYIAAISSTSEDSALATVFFTLKSTPSADSPDQPSTKVLYVQVPLMYDAKSNSVAVSGYPTFIPPVNPAAPKNDSNYQVNWPADDDVTSVVEERTLPQFFGAWAASNSNSLANYITKDATPVALEGLHGAVVPSASDFVSEVSVEQAGSGDSTGRSRNFQATVAWKDPTSNVSYSQVYRGRVEQNSNNTWLVKDIKNAAAVDGSAGDGADE